jgi:hypothetical protein
MLLPVQPPGEECAGTTGRAAEMRATYLQSPLTAFLVTAATGRTR